MGHTYLLTTHMRRDIDGKEKQRGIFMPVVAPLLIGLAAGLATMALFSLYKFTIKYVCRKED